MLKKSRNKTVKPENNRNISRTVAVLMISALIPGILAGCKAIEKPAVTTLASTTVKQTVTEPAAVINPLTGLPNFNENALGKRPVAVVISNAPSARPQWGLCSPDIVIEGVVEGGVTRMLGLYADIDTIPKIGPMRSARHDFVEIAEGFNAVFVHWGQSIYARRAMNDRGVDDIEGNNYVGTYFFRDKSRHVAIEHTGYTTGENIKKAISDFNMNTEIGSAYASPFKFVSEDKTLTPSGGSCGSISFEFSQSFRHEFRFDASDKLYYNYLNSNPMVQDGGKQMAVTNVIVLYCGVGSMYDSAGCIDMDLAEGVGIYASNGGYEDISWEKGGPKDMLKLYNAEGNQITLNSGKSYIGFVPSSQKNNTEIS